ncbi:glutamate receptor ionotropic, kainate 5 isoform X1 [Anguilla anguilla]|uniref:glutamate receptor ionotropic, kainate 5 isoform X1 n=1 Tax=Anguilla anguilla TaxID=7936 RepID=UPI0015AAF0BC|nr:glutamate receptor ionotropic, kainate 5 isoform X1 [Anguilla anguilla]XP_035268359.1 glutamate receptor ionotropic, kainate 5 isoform X1 [Anguilla anguilla]XP_035268368.1 glutamate receptor ionotropic, kainate 5 isoform X1 [Anguilla anguilla]XP_035268378.1 glutamate receptor ionotropic, kainate 5 isoform X1 [Anguilla anguilla]XP_035268385.1 glutamate receptor ionotropic, kainate 5 isoform X1 [Anguilla anguilla]XP_035268394.1 glutamate receptor ionotropic, kainate 5 isoform X1 [Anguilla ang
MPALPALLLSIRFVLPLLTVAPSSCSQAPVLSSVRMAAILDDQSVCGRGERHALALARENINSMMEGPAMARVEVDIFELQRDSQYETTDTMCQILPKGVVSVIGPASSPASGSTVSHICGEKEIPHVKIGPEETPRLPYLRFASVSLYPSNEDLSLAVGAILRSFSYPSASLVCAKAECLLRLEELVRRFLISRETLSIRMLDDSLDPTPLLKEIRDDKVATIIIDANASISYLILKKASELGMTSAFYKYILTTMDFPLLRLDDIVDEQSNIVGFSMFNTSHPFYLEFIRSLNLSWREGCDLSPYPGPALSSALMFDAVHVVVGAVRELNRSQEIGVKPLSCTSPQIWQHGTSLMNYLRMVEYDGLTGRVEFNSKGQRTNYTLRILEKHRGGHKEIGIWYSNNTLAMNSTTLDINVSETLANKTLIVTTILENPYVMRRGNYQDLRGNDQYEGFCVDMLKELADMLKFSFRIKLVDDGLYGAPEPNGSWTGMVGELINRKADLAVAGFTITSEREKVIDFSKPFMNLGISILYRVQLGRKPGYFSFLDPFSPAVWLFMLLAYLAVSCVLFLAARLSPYEWYNPHPCLRERRDVLENQYTLGNSLWFPIGGFMQQGSEIMPRALSTRCVSGVWWAFTLIIISSYTANLAAFLTVQRMEVPIESPDDLADQTNIEYGTIHGGSTMTFFMNSRYQTYQRMWNYMHSKQPSVFVKSTEEGIARVLNSKYAFLLESTMNEYHRRLNCNLTQIGGLLDTKGYGIGMPLGSPFRDEITLAILQLQENNRLEILKRRWWEGGQCPKEEDHRAKGLGMENIGGIFVVLICGLIIAVFVAIMEFVWSTRRSAETDELVSVCQEMLTEFRNAISCKKSSRSRRRRPLTGPGGPRHPTRVSLAAPRPLRLVREMRLSNGKLYSGSGPLTGGAGAGGGPSDMGPGPQRLLEDPLGANTTPPPPPPPAAPSRSCTHIRICQECRRIQSLRSTSTRIPPSSAPLPRLPPPPPPSSSNTDSEGGGGASPRRLHHTPPPRPLPPAQSSTSTDLLGEQD